MRATICSAMFWFAPMTLRANLIRRDQHELTRRALRRAASASARTCLIASRTFSSAERHVYAPRHETICGVRVRKKFPGENTRRDVGIAG